MAKTILRSTAFLLLSLGIGLSMSATPALANTAANTQIINNADLSYDDGGGTKHAAAQVTVTVALKSAQPTIIKVADQAGPYPTPLTDDFFLTNNSNGPETFNLTTSVNTMVNGTVVAVPVTTPVTLGATVTIGGSYSDATSTYVYVPSDGVSNASINGIKLTATVVINGIERTVRAITDNGSGFSIIQVDKLPADPGAGVVVGEKTTVHATVTPSARVTATANVTANVTMTATSSTDNTVSATSGNVANTFYPVSASLTKYVRNVTNANGASASFITINGITYWKDPYTTQVTAKPGEVLEYVLVASNSSATAVSQVVLTDLVPVDYLTLPVAGAGPYGGKAFRYFPDASVTSGAGSSIDYTISQGDDAVDYNQTFDTTAGAKKGQIKAWIGGAAPAYNTNGTIAGNKSIILMYQATVNP